MSLALEAGPDDDSEGLTRPPGRGRQAAAEAAGVVTESVPLPVATGTGMVTATGTGTGTPSPGREPEQAAVTSGEGGKTLPGAGQLRRIPAVTEQLDH